MTVRRILAIMAVVLCATQTWFIDPTHAQAATQTDAQAALEAMSAASQKGRQEDEIMSPTSAFAIFNAVSDPEHRAKMEAAYAENYVADIAHARAVYTWQLQSTRNIFWAVIALVAAGMVFSALQFWKSFSTPIDLKTGASLDLNTELELGTSGVKVSSPVLGVIILVISLGFFYLFLVHVYPIKYVSGAIVSTG